ncbi:MULTISPECIES: hypothetical protein [Ponticaulis]|jgi:hypothetical protein|uniref:hypothetical protein n=1 Tax=Ponticaulis TaxID=1123044 RepID=UPI0003B42877|nr:MULTISPECIES: hypothetical protein [Ponticaulis]HBH90166.1 hypothetical protein [Hyphomonadaceae bacterium]MAJ10116.1 hypothetical protein [Ponticaulis sp.]MBN03576.1 hypothetical protein [Ponticaulis sp.]MDF1680602.1 hypothetical protein [Ponticaulis sp.]HBJ93384.1 hypothetical protein [Hyphomonadaceae bacterium]|tara:strand:+ start:6996 stop:7193 length:198 start_codon:yes stop_codon:yes gene_type:complete
MAQKTALRVTLAAMAAFSLSGCIATTAVGLAAETVEAGVEITGAVIGTSVDLVTTSEEERERDRD